MVRLTLAFFMACFLIGCQSNPPAPVVNKSPQIKNTKTTNKTSKINNGDWRPNTYIVKQGDTLYSIGLAHGYYYKDIAAANNIGDPYPINIGQRLNFSSLKNKDNANPTNIPNEDGVVLTPIDSGAIDSGQVVSAVTPVISEPKATREPYSVEALNRQTTSKPATNNKSNTTTSTPPIITSQPVTTSTIVVSSTGWSWPTAGKVTSKFSPSRNKGIDIAGKKGQAIKAAAPGKVIYTGSDLRGYGKLVIIKHNKTFLSVYAHNSKIMTKEGQAVKAGQKIAEMGDSDTNTVKLHFEIRKQGKSIDPAQYLPQN